MCSEIASTTKVIFEKSQKSKDRLYIPFKVNLIHQPRFDFNELHRRPEFAPGVKAITLPNPAPERPIVNTNLVNQPSNNQIDGSLRDSVSDDNLFQDQFDGISFCSQLI